MAGPIVLVGYATLNSKPEVTLSSPEGDVTIALARKTIVVTLPGGPPLTFDALAIADALSKAQSAYLPGAEPIRFTATQDGVSADLIFVAGYGSSTAQGVDVNSLTLWLVWNK